jgi:predicted NUDIX family phosphoesterase
MSERVLGFPASRLEPFLKNFAGGFVNDPDLVRTILSWVLDPAVLSYKDREEAETDETFKQVIPYCVLRWGKHYLAYQRTKKGQEVRLHDKWSLGVGGHINPQDGETGSPEMYGQSVRRELFEEVGLDRVYPEDIGGSIGLLYDDSNQVGRVHFGVVHLVDIAPRASLTFGDNALSSSEWFMLPELVQMSNFFENWSQLVIQHLLP